MVHRKIVNYATEHKSALIFAAGIATAVVGKKILESKVVKEATNLPDEYVAMVVSYIQFLQFQVNKKAPHPRTLGLLSNRFEFIAEDFFVLCNKCSTTGPLGETKDEAIAAWNWRV